MTPLKRRDKPSFDRGRRAFLLAMLQELPVLHGTLKGGQGFRLTDLSALPDQQLARIRPIVNPDYVILVQDGAVWARYRHRQEPPIRLFGTDEGEKQRTFNLFDGRHTLGEIGSQLSRALGEDEATAFSRARDLFLALVRHMVCVPRDPLGLPEG